MRPKTLLILFLVALALGAFIWLWERHQPSSEERAERAKKVLPLEQEEIRALEVEWNDQRLRLERRAPEVEETETGAETEGEPAAPAGDAEWRITEPLQARADGAAVGRLLSSLTGLEKERTLEQYDPQELGLEEPRARVTVQTDDGERVLEIGTEVPASLNMIVAPADGDEAYVVARSLFTDLTKEPGAWRDKKVFQGSRAAIEHLRVKRDDQELLLARRGDRFWVESPYSDRADAERVRRALDALVGLQVKTFLDEPQESPAEMGLEPPRLVVEAVLEGREMPFRLELGRAGDEEAYYARADGQLFTTETELVEELAAAPAWRARSWSAMKSWEVDAWRLEDAEGALELERVNGDWKRGDDKISYSPVSDFLSKVTDAEAETLLTSSEARDRDLSLEEPRWTLILTGSDDDDDKEVLHLYGATAEGVAAKTEGREVVLLLSPDEVSEMESALAAVRSAEPLEEEAEGEVSSEE